MEKEKNKETCTCEKDSCKCEDQCSCEKDSCECEEHCSCSGDCSESVHCDCGENCECGDFDDEEQGKSCNCKDEKEKSKKELKKEKKEKKEKQKQEIESLNIKIKDLETKVLQEKAELINYRKRKDEEVSYMLKYANEDMVKELLQTIDNFERAIKLDDDNLEDELSKFLEGFKMIYCNLIKTLENYGVKAIDGGNKPFDPTYHQAVLTEARDGVESGMVLEVLQKGYLLKDKVIRPAMVKVSE